MSKEMENEESIHIDKSKDFTRFCKEFRDKLISMGSKFSSRTSSSGGNSKKYQIVGILSYLNKEDLPSPFGERVRSDNFGSVLEPLYFPLFSEDVLYLFLDGRRVFFHSEEGEDAVAFDIGVKALTMIFMLANQVVVFSKSFDCLNFMKLVHRCFQLRKELSFSLDPYMKAYFNTNSNTFAYNHNHHNHMRGLADTIMISSPAFLSILLFQRDLDERSCRTMEKKLNDLFYAASIDLKRHKMRNLFVLPAKGYIRGYPCSLSDFGGGRYSYVTSDLLNFVERDLMSEEEEDIIVSNCENKCRLCILDLAGLIDFVADVMTLSQEKLHEMGLENRESLVRLVKYLERTTSKSDARLESPLYPIHEIEDMISEKALRDAKALYHQVFRTTNGSSSNGTTEALSYYGQDIHEKKLNGAISLLQTRCPGSHLASNITLLSDYCESIWRDGRQRCLERSLVGSFCDLKAGHSGKHITKSEFTMTCSCGNTQIRLLEPWSQEDANVSFFIETCCDNYETLKACCSNPQFSVIRLGDFKDFNPKTLEIMQPNFIENMNVLLVRSIAIHNDKNLSCYYGLEYECRERGHRMIPRQGKVSTKAPLQPWIECLGCPKDHPKKAYLQRIFLVIGSGLKVTLSFSLLLLPEDEQVINLSREGMYVIRLPFSSDLTTRHYHSSWFQVFRK